jgi:gamma-carbonic anhydrase
VVHGAQLADRAFVGMGAVAMDGSRIASGGMLGAGALLSPGKQIGEGEIWIGRPAKYFRTKDAAQLEKIRFQTERYCKLAERHLAELKK